MAFKFTVLINGHNEPRQANQSGSLNCFNVQTGEQMWIGVWPDKLAPFQPHIGTGVPVTINATSREGNNGRTYYNATSIDAGGMQQAGQAANWQAPPQQTAQAAPNYAQQAPQAPQVDYAAKEAEKVEGMFIMAVVGRAMGSGQFTMTDVKPLTLAAVEAWRGRHDGQNFHHGGAQGVSGGHNQDQYDDQLPIR